MALALQKQPVVYIWSVVVLISSQRGGKVQCSTCTVPSQPCQATKLGWSPSELPIKMWQEVQQLCFRVSEQHVPGVLCVLQNCTRHVFFANNISSSRLILPACKCLSDLSPSTAVWAVLVTRLW